MNINTKLYWNHRFEDNDWETKGGREQTRAFAEALVARMELPHNWSGVLLDFGCGLGDSIPIYRQRLPRATLIGIDVSDAAIEKCRERYGHIAAFRAGGHEQVPQVDVIAASNVFEHLSDDLLVAQHLLARCRDFFILVPYRERLVLGTEHVNSYDESSFDSLGLHCKHIFACRGWSQYGKERWVDVHLKNVARTLLGRRRVQRNRQILFHLVNPAFSRTTPAPPSAPNLT